MQIVLSADVVIVVTALSTRWFPVASIANVRTGGYGIVFTLDDGRRIRSALVTASAADLKVRRFRRAGVQRRIKLAKEIEDAVSAAVQRERDRRDAQAPPVSDTVAD